MQTCINRLSFQLLKAHTVMGGWMNKNLNANRDKRSHMRFQDWRLISSFGYVFGGLFLLLGLYGYLYYETNLIGQMGLLFTPYQSYALPILIVGIALMTMGYFTERQAREKKNEEKQQPIATIGVCPNCGAKRDSDALYCKKCGKKFEWWPPHFFARVHTCVSRLCEEIEWNMKWLFSWINRSFGKF